LHTLAHKISQVLDDPARLQQMKINARRLGRPQAAFDIARAALRCT
jgi:UDP-N-acetylglucosamine:LPS N-acetylglucosamine transferase